MSEGGGRTFEWDIDNRVTSVTMGGTTTMEYDYTGMRVKKHGGGITLYPFQGVEIDPNGVMIKFIRIGTETFASHKGTGDERYYYHNDHLGGVNVITDKNGGRVQLIEYDPWGGVSRNEGDINVDPTHRFTGKELDPETGLYYYGGRYYDPEISRFISPDPFVQDEEDPQNLNRYSYVDNDPINYTDPSGYFYMSKSGAGGGLLGSFLGSMFGALISIVTGIPVFEFLEPILGTTAAAVVSGEVAGSLSGAVSAGISGGNPFKSFFLGGVTGGAMGFLSGSLAGSLAPAADPLAAAEAGPTQLASADPTVTLPEIHMVKDAAIQRAINSEALREPAVSPMDFIGVGAGVAKIAMGAGVSLARQAIARGLTKEVAESFSNGAFRAVILKSEVTVARVFGGEEAKVFGRFLTRASAAPTRAAAFENLRLPATNLATNIAEIVIPRGTPVFVGKVAFGNAPQYFVPQEFIKDFIIKSVRGLE
jgi:RHS repeat-associated protein